MRACREMRCFIRAKVLKNYPPGGFPESVPSPFYLISRLQTTCILIVHVDSPDSRSDFRRRFEYRYNDIDRSRTVIERDSDPSLLSDVHEFMHAFDAHRIDRESRSLLLYLFLSLSLSLCFSLSLSLFLSLSRFTQICLDYPEGCHDALSRPAGV